MRCLNLHTPTRRRIFASKAVDMNKNIVLLVISLSGFAAPAFALDLPFTDSNLTNCVREIIEKKQWQSLDDITTVECHSKKISSLAGIEQLVGLQKLSLYNNNLTQAHLSNLPVLRHINLAKNQITRVKLAQLPALAELYLFGNHLGEFHLQHLPALQLLKINDNRILTFTYQDLPALQKIYMFNNLMEHIDIYHLPAMKYMDARQNPMPDPLYEEMDKMTGVTFLHDGNAEDWQ
jgi:protein phosphatase 1 regulatory subunit 7